MGVVEQHQVLILFLLFFEHRSKLLAVSVLSFLRFFASICFIFFSNLLVCKCCEQASHLGSIFAAWLFL